MRSRSFLLFPILFVLLALTSWYFYDGIWRAPVVDRQSNKTTSDIAPVAATSSFSLAETMVNHLLHLGTLLTKDAELITYALAAAFGLLMMIVALKIARPGKRQGAEAMLRLLKEEKEKAENMARLKAEFLNQVSHELRTPLAVIIGYLECLTDGLYGNVNPKHQDILRIVATQSGHLRNMIDQILIYSRLEASKQPLRTEEFSPASVLIDLRDTFEFLCRQKGLQLAWQLPHSTGFMRGDPTRFKDIASNLLQNAVKYTDSGSITVLLNESTVTHSIVLEVRDTGIGISQAAIGTIFDPFTQVHKTSTENSRGGIGLGLSIIKRHVEQMRGSVSVASELGGGSTFTVVLPRYYRTQGSKYRLWQVLNASYVFLRTASAKVQATYNKRLKDPPSDRAGVVS